MNSTAILPNRFPLLLDGGMGSELRRRGVPLDRNCWSATANLEHSDLVAQIHGEYVAAGADIITTNTFGAARFVLESAGLSDRFDQIVDGAVASARRAAQSADRRIAVAGSMSCLPPAMGRSAYPAADVESDGYRELADRLATGGVDLLLLEMLQSPQNSARVLHAAAETGLPVVAGFSCRLAPRSDPTNPTLQTFDAPHDPVSKLIATIEELNPAAICVMHSPPDAIAPALELVANNTNRPRGAYAELPYEGDPGTRLVTDVMSPAEYAERALEWVSLGAGIVGGCCGTTPAHIAALRTKLDS